MKRPQSKRKRLGALLAVLAGSTLGVGVLASAAVVAPQAGASSNEGSIEICKDFAPPPGTFLNTTWNLTPSFTFNLSGGIGSGAPSSITVQASSGSTPSYHACSAPISVEGGQSVTITEQSPGPWSEVSQITDMNGNIVGTPNLGTGSVTVSVPVGKSDLIDFVNDPVLGSLKVCKYSAANPAPGVSGSFLFDLSGPNGYTLKSVSANVGQCSNVLNVPAGQVTVTEEGANLNVSSITATISGGSNAVVGSPNLVAGQATVNVEPSGSGNPQTWVNYDNELVTVKVCKVWSGGGTPPVSSYTFNVTTGTPSPQAGASPTSLPSSITVSLGNMIGPFPYGCSAIGNVVAGTPVTLTEVRVPGTKVQSNGIYAGGAATLPAATAPAVNPDIANQTITIIAGEATSGIEAPLPALWEPLVTSNEALVLFANKAADPGTLEVCVNAGTPAPTHSGPYTFSVTPAPTGVTMAPVTVNLGKCTNVVDPSGNPITFPFASQVTVKATSYAPDQAMTPVTVNPANLT